MLGDFASPLETAKTTSSSPKKFLHQQLKIFTSSDNFESSFSPPPHLVGGSRHNFPNFYKSTITRSVRDCLRVTLKLAFGEPSIG